MNFYQDLGFLVFGSRLKRLGDIFINDVNRIYKDYKIENYPNIIMGRDAQYYLPLFFKIESLPAIYVYDKKGKFKQAFSGSVKIDKIAAAL